MTTPPRFSMPAMVCPHCGHRVVVDLATVATQHRDDGDVFLLDPKVVVDVSPDCDEPPAFQELTRGEMINELRQLRARRRKLPRWAMRLGL